MSGRLQPEIEEGATSEGDLSASQLGAYGFLTMPLAMAGLVLLTYLPTFYAVDMGLGLALVGIIAVAGRFLDVITDPVIGYLSDRTKTRFGPRKPWLVVGMVGFCITLWLLLSPPADAGVWYLALVGAGYFLFLTVLDVPYSSVGLELSPNTTERTRLAGSKAAFQVTGAIAAGFFPFILALSVAESLPLLAATIIVLTLTGTGLFLWSIPVPQQTHVKPRLRFADAVGAMVSDQRYRYLIGSFAIVQAGNAFFSGLSVLYVTYILGAGPMVGLLLGLMFLATALFLPLWHRLSVQFGKMATWKAGIATSCFALLLIPLIGSDHIFLAAVVFVVMGATFGSDAVMPTSMLADLSHDTVMRGNLRQSGLYLATKNAASKLAFVAPMGIAFPILGWLEFETVTDHSAATEWVFLAFFAGAPIALKLIALTMLRYAPSLDGTARETTVAGEQAA